MSSQTHHEAERRNARAVWFVAPQEVELRSESVGFLEADEIRVRAHTSLVSAGTEMSVYSGTAGSAEAVDLPTTEVHIHSR